MSQQESRRIADQVAEAHREAMHGLKPAAQIAQETFVVEANLDHPIPACRDVAVILLSCCLAAIAMEWEDSEGAGDRQALEVHHGALARMEEHL